MNAHSEAAACRQARRSQHVGPDDFDAHPPRMRSSRPRPNLSGQGLPPVDRAIWRFIVFTWRIRFGWVLALIAAIVLAWPAVALLPVFGDVPSAVGALALWMLLLAFAFIGVLCGMARRALRGPTTAWRQLTTPGKAGRLLLTAAMTVAFLAPLVWFATLVLRKV